MEQQQILLADTEDQVRQEVERLLSASSFGIVTESKLAGACERLRHSRFSAVYLHQAVANDQFERICRSARQNDPALVLVAAMEQTNGELEERLFDAGVDDVVVGPTSPVAIAKRILLRIENRSLKYYSDKVVRIGEAVVNFETLEVWHDGRSRRISKGLAQLLRYFLDNQDRPISRTEVCDSLWADSIVDPEGKNLDVHVSKLRAVIEPDPKNPTFICTLRGMGYIFRGVSAQRASAHLGKWEAEPHAQLQVRGSVLRRKMTRPVGRGA